MVTNEDEAWLAGLMDGEGTISLSNAKHKSRRWISPLVKIANTNEELLEAAATIIGEIVFQKPNWQRSTRTGHKPCFEIRIQKRPLIGIICRELLPYLRGKKKQAELMISFLSSESRYGRRSGTGVTKTTETQIAFMREMQFLNKRYSAEEWQKLSEARDLTGSSGQPDDGKVRTVPRGTEVAEMTTHQLKLVI